MKFLDPSDLMQEIELAARIDHATATVPFTVRVERYDSIERFDLRFDRPEYVLSFYLNCICLYVEKFSGVSLPYTSLATDSQPTATTS